MTRSIPPAPRPPVGTPITFNLKGTQLVVDTGALFSWKAPIAGASIHTLDNTGKRTTITRVALMGPLALLAKKKTGDVNVVVVGADGSTATAKVKPRHAQAIITWAVAFNAWSEATRG
ncbi:hypothetical protein [Kitasatospora sp. NBC_01302]|uniref:hypothetical protein n=1 Tax=Kitasatospora sp. NBC_01302 TaxID=2903575 RepID=UPI002E0F5CB6|nr:hypothetical protein OG294_14365 [Kitasatospora sp. NBC_01302]